MQSEFGIRSTTSISFSIEPIFKNHSFKDFFIKKKVEDELRKNVEACRNSIIDVDVRDKTVYMSNVKGDAQAASHAINSAMISLKKDIIRLKKK